MINQLPKKIGNADISRIYSWACDGKYFKS